MTAEPEHEMDERTPLLARRWVGAAVLAIAVIVAFGSAIDGELVWDDATTVGAAAALRSPWAAFSRDFFALGARAAEGAGASYFRPLVALSFALDVKVFSGAPQFGLHLVTLGWHVIASIFVAGALVRWTRAASLQARIACFVAALLWAVLPAKAENVAWISGRADAMGLALLLAGTALYAAEMNGAKRIPARIATIAFATAAALACKESFVVAPLIVAIELGFQHEDARARDTLIRVIRAPEMIASAFVVVAYLALRRAYLPMHGGGEAMFAGLSMGDRAALVIETLGHAAQSIVLCFETRLLRGPIGFTAPFVLKRDGGMEIFGVAFVAIVATIAWRAPRQRPAMLLLAGAMLPVANVIPSGLEARFSDRFLYVPSLGIALGIACVLATARARAVVIGVATGALGLMLVSARRSSDFRSSQSLWERERRHKAAAPTVLHNAATAAMRERRYEDARDRFIETATRYGELGFDEGYPYLVAAVEAQILATGEADAASYGAYRKLLEGWLSGARGKVTVQMPNGRSLRVPVGTPDAMAYAESHARDIRMRIALLDARKGLESASAAAKTEVDACPKCRGVLRLAARVDLALAHPDRAGDWLSRLGPDEEAERDALAVNARVAAALLRTDDAMAKARALFVGEAYGPACKLGVKALDGAPAIARATIGIACKLAGDAEGLDKVKVGLDREMVKEIESSGDWGYRRDPMKRLQLFGVKDR